MRLFLVWDAESISETTDTIVEDLFTAIDKDDDEGHVKVDSKRKDKSKKKKRSSSDTEESKESDEGSDSSQSDSDSKAANCLCVWVIGIQWICFQTGLILITLSGKTYIMCEVCWLQWETQKGDMLMHVQY